MLNDILQSLIPALYPSFKQSLNLSFTEIGLITFAFQATASMLQPLVGIYTDRYPKPFSLAGGMLCTLCGLLMLAQSNSLSLVLFSVMLVGMGSSIFHPEASRMARLASGGKHGFAQSLFQVGGNFGTALGPLLAALVVVPRGQAAISWFSILALLAFFILLKIGIWYRAHLQRSSENESQPVAAQALSARNVVFALGILMFLIISKFFYMVSLSNYYTFYLISKFGVSIRESQILLFIFLFAVAAGTYAGGPLGDRFGRKIVIWFSIAGAAPFTLMLPHASLIWTVALSVIIGLILSSAFSAIIVFAQELLPGRIGLVSGLFFGFAFGVSGIASALLGNLADQTSIEYVFYLCGYLPLIGLLAVFLPVSSHAAQAKDG